MSLNGRRAVAVLALAIASSAAGWMVGGAPVAGARPAGVAATAAAGRLRARGEAIFTGRSPVSGRIRGHESDLPPEVVACRQCHLASTPDAGTSPAPRLDRAFLRQPIQRRGGPPSAYDLASFCKLLRTGVDPAYVLIDRIMPTYQLSDPDCAALWEYVTR